MAMQNEFESHYARWRHNPSYNFKKITSAATSRTDWKGYRVSSNRRMGKEGNNNDVFGHKEVKQQCEPLISVTDLAM